MALTQSILQVYNLTPFPIQTGIQSVVVRQQAARNISAHKFILTMTNAGAKMKWPTKTKHWKQALNLV